MLPYLPLSPPGKSDSFLLVANELTPCSYVNTYLHTYLPQEVSFEKMGGDVVSIFAMSEWPQWVMYGVPCAYSQSLFCGIQPKRAFVGFFGLKQSNLLYCIVLYCIGSKRDGEIGWILTWEKIKGHEK